MRWHWLKFRAVAHPTEDPSKVARALFHLSNLDSAVFEEDLQAEAVTTHHGADMTVLELQISRAREIRGALEHLLPDPAALGDLEPRVDDDGVLYMRFDKQAAFDGRVRLGGKDSIQVRAKPEVHPTGRDRALEAMEAWRGPL